MTTEEVWKLDESKLQQADLDRKELYLFQWLSNLEKTLQTAPRDVIKTYQAGIEKTILKYINCAIPRPSRPVRHLFGRIGNLLYSRGDERSLFDTLAATQNLLGLKKVDDPLNRIAAVYVCGILSETHGSKVQSLFAESVNLIMKHFKAAKEIELSLRYECLMAMTRALRGAGKASSDATTKELIKIAKSQINDKVLIIRAASLELLQSLYLHTAQLPPLKLEEYEALLSQISKAMEGANFTVRQAAAATSASLLSLSQSPPPESKLPVKKPTTAIADKPILSVDEMMSLLTSQMVKAPTREVRVGIFEVYFALFKGMGIKFMENNYTAISNNIVELSGHPKLNISWNDVVMMREGCGFLLRSIGKMISEGGQSNALKELTSGWLKRGATIDTGVNKNILTCALNEVSGLLIDLGSAASSHQDLMLETLLSLLNHPAESVNISLSWSLRCLCFALPGHLQKLISKLISNMQKDANVLASDKPEQIKRFSYHGNALASLITVIPHRAMFASFETSAKVFGLATQLIKASTASASKDYRVLTVQAQIAWTLIASLMNLGPHFVRVHLSQLLLFWKNVFAKTTGKDSTAYRSEQEVVYQLTLRENALSALHSFLLYNSKDLLSSDVAKRIVVSLSNVCAYISTPSTVLPPNPTNPGGSSSSSQQKSGPITFLDRENMVRKRLFDCFILIPTKYYETLFSVLLKATMESFSTDPEKVPDHRGALASQVGEKGNTTIDFWGVTSLVKGMNANVSSYIQAEDRGIGRVMVRDIEVQVLEELSEPYTLNAVENDPFTMLIQNHTAQSLLLTGSQTKADELSYVRPCPCPATISSIDSAIELFSIIYPLQNAQVQEMTLEGFIKTSKTTKAVGPRKVSYQLNVLTALIGFLKHVMMKRGVMASGRVSVAIRDLLEDMVVNAHPLIRTLSCDTLGRLCRVVSTTAFVNTLIQNLVDQVVKNRDPDTRSGASLALGCIHSYVGGMAAGSHLKTIVGILHSLASDPHPLVHTWALHSLWLTIDSAGLNYFPYVNSTLTVIVKLHMADSHEPTAPLANAPGGDSNADIYPSLGRILYSLLGVLGPELQFNAKTRDLCFSLFEELKNDGEPFVMVEALKCIQHFILFAPKYMDINTLVPFLQMQLTGGHHHPYLKRKAAITCFYQLVQRDPTTVRNAAVNNQLEEQLFALLDTEMDHFVQDEIKDILIRLLKDTAPESPSRWLELCKGILSKAGVTGIVVADSVQALAQHNLGAGGDDDDDGDGPSSAVPSSQGPAPTSKQPITLAKQASTVPGFVVILVPRWRTQVFALSCLRQVIPVIKAIEKPEHFDLKQARISKDSGKSSDLLILRLADLVRVAFNASTAHVYELCLGGLRFLQDILETFTSSRDPDVDNQSILEQYQAQISAALTPAFSVESSIEVKSLACQVAAAYISSGINEDANALGRILKCLVSCLESCKEESSEYSPHAQLLLRLSVLSGWAEVQNSSSKFRLAKEVIQPHLPVLVPMWVNSLKDYAKIKSDLELALSLLSSGANVETAHAPNLDVYMSATRELILPLYKSNWLTIMQAVASLADINDKHVIDVLNPNLTGSLKVYNALYGLSIEALSTIGFRSGTAANIPGVPSIAVASSGQNAKKVSANQEKHMLKTVLDCLRKMTSVKIVGEKFFEKYMFIELINILDQIVQAEDVPIQLMVVKMLDQIITDYGSAYMMLEDEDSSSAQLSSSIDDLRIANDFSTSIPPSSKLYHLVRILLDTFTFHVPAISRNPAAAMSADRQLSTESAALQVIMANSMTNIAMWSLPPPMLFSYIPVVLQLFVAILGTEKLAEDVGSKLLMMIKMLMDKIDQSGSEEDRRGISEVLQSAVSSLLDALISDEDEAEEIDEPSSSAEMALMKNILLTLVVMHTAVPQLCHHPDNLARLCSFLKRTVTHSSEKLALISLQCVKALTISPITSAKPNSIEIAQSVVRSTAPVILSHLYSSASLYSQTMVEGLRIAVEWTVSYQNLLSDSRSFSFQYLSLLTALLVRLLAPASESTGLPNFTSQSHKDLHVLALTSLLQLATSQQALFKIVVQILPDVDKIRFEKSVKSMNSINSGGLAGNSTSMSGAQSDAAPKIQLRAF